MMTNIIKAKIDEVENEYLDILYNIIKAFVKSEAHSDGALRNT